MGQAISNFRKSYRDGMTIDVTPKERLDDDSSKPKDDKKPNE
jgi:hypothetical protein